MKFLPFENFYIVTNLKPEEVQKRLEKEIAPPRGFNLKYLFESDPNFYFKGYSVNGTFEIQRIISYRNSFLPQIKGATEPYLNGSRIHVKMRMMILVTVFICFWLGVVGMAGIAMFLKQFNGSDFAPQSLIPLAMFVFGCILTIGGLSLKAVRPKPS